MAAPAGHKLCLNGCFTVLPLTAFGANLNSPDGHMARCKSCELDRISVAKHGLNPRQKAILAREQGGCRICRRTEPGKKGWVVDHDHTCCPGDSSCPNCRRGILCSWCNTALGYAMDSPDLLRRMADYLETGERIDVPEELTWQPEWVSRASQSTESVNRVTRTDKDGRTDRDRLTQVNHLASRNAHRGGKTIHLVDAEKPTPVAK